MIRSNLIAARRIATRRLVAVRPASGSAPEHGQLSGVTQRTAQQEWEAAAREDRLDFMTASKMLLSESSRPRKFGLDFHIVQFVLACIPSLAVYLVALYARSEMRRMEKVSKATAWKKEKEDKEADRNQKYPPPAAEITHIKARLEAIEGVVQELRSEVSKPAVTVSVEEGKESQTSAPAGSVPSIAQTAPAR